MANDNGMKESAVPKDGTAEKPLGKREEDCKSGNGEVCSAAQSERRGYDVPPGREAAQEVYGHGRGGAGGQRPGTYVHTV